MSGDTLHVPDYSKPDWEWSMFDPTSRHKRHEIVFPQEGKKIFEMGKEMAAVYGGAAFTKRGFS